MENKNTQRLINLTIICKVNENEEMLKLVSEHDGHLTNVIYGKGSCKKGALAQAFGLDDDYKKAVNSLYNFNKKNTGIAFGVLVEGLLF